MAKSIKQLCEIIAAKEGGKHEASIGDIREIVRIIGDHIADDKEWLEILYQYAIKRAQRKRK